MAEIIDLDDYREFEDVDVFIEFIGLRFELPEGGTIKLTFSTTVPSDRIAETLAGFRDNGGLYMPNEETGTMWFLPWPPVAIRMRAANHESVPIEYRR